MRKDQWKRKEKKIQLTLKSGTKKLLVKWLPWKTESNIWTIN